MKDVQSVQAVFDKALEVHFATERSAKNMAKSGSIEEKKSFCTLI